MKTIKYISAAPASVLIAFYATAACAGSSASQYPLPEAAMSTMQSADASYSADFMKNSLAGQVAEWTNPMSGVSYKLKTHDLISLVPMCKKYSIVVSIGSQKIYKGKGTTCLDMNHGTWTHK
ncbi:MAG TPA: hypothetical protein VKA31_03435 [Mariprofundaceae bacterium]|nr:hypothetical protein [Mariprofundaceae bacterium]